MLNSISRPVSGRSKSNFASVEHPGEHVQTATYFRSVFLTILPRELGAFDVLAHPRHSPCRLRPTFSLSVVGRAAVGAGVVCGRHSRYERASASGRMSMSEPSHCPGGGTVRLMQPRAVTRFIVALTCRAGRPRSSPGSSAGQWGYAPALGWSAAALTLSALDLGRDRPARRVGNAPPRHRRRSVPPDLGLRW